MKKNAIFIMLIAVILVLGSTATAKERRGADVVVTKNDGSRISGELIAVRENALLLYESSARDVTVEVSEIWTVKIRKRITRGVGTGTLIGGAAGAAFGAIAPEEVMSRQSATLFMGLLGAGAGAIIGLVAGSGSSRKTIVIGPSPGEDLNKALSVLRKNARFREDH